MLVSVKVNLYAKSKDHAMQAQSECKILRII
jgi:hypothetical protein